MLRWQLLNRDKKQQIALQLMLLSFLFHILFGILLFFVYRQDGSTVHLQLNSSFVVNPACVMIATTQEQLRSAQQYKKNTQAASVGQMQKVTRVQKNPTSVASVQKVVPAPAKKNIFLPKEKEQVAVKSAQLPVKKIEKKDLVLPQKQEQTVEKKASEYPQQKKSEQLLAAIEQAPGGTLDVVYATAREVELYRQQQLLTQEIAQYWKPPAGISADCACQITFTVNWQGALVGVAITESSGILMYDLAARSAICMMKMPEWTKGKTFTILLHNGDKGIV